MGTASPLARMPAGARSATPFCRLCHALPMALGQRQLGLHGAAIGAATSRLSVMGWPAPAERERHRQAQRALGRAGRARCHPQLGGPALGVQCQRKVQAQCLFGRCRGAVGPAQEHRPAPPGWPGPRRAACVPVLSTLASPHVATRRPACRSPVAPSHTRLGPAPAHHHPAKFDVKEQRRRCPDGPSWRSAWGPARPAAGPGAIRHLAWRTSNMAGRNAHLAPGGGRPSREKRGPAPPFSRRQRRSAAAGISSPCTAQLPAGCRAQRSRACPASGGEDDRKANVLVYMR